MRTTLHRHTRGYRLYIFTGFSLCLVGVFKKFHEARDYVVGDVDGTSQPTRYFIIRGTRWIIPSRRGGYAFRDLNPDIEEIMT